MAKTIQFKRGTTAQVNAFTGALGEVVVDTDKDVLVVHDGVTAGGFPNATRANADGTVTVLAKAGTNLGTISASGLFNNTLTSTATTQALTAAQGKVLQDGKLEASNAFGINQTWTNMLASRAGGVTYTNSTGRPIHVLVMFVLTTGGSTPSAVLDGVGGYAGSTQTTVGNISAVSFTVPVDGTYSVSGGTNMSLNSWRELR